MTEHTADATFMTIREIVKEMRDEQKDLKKTLDRLEKDMVTKAEFQAFKQEATVTKRWKVGTGLTLAALALSVLALVAMVV